MVKIASVILGVGLVLGVFVLTSFAMANSDPITSEQLRQAMVVDVRSPEEFKAGHFPGAVNIPLDQIASVAPKLKIERQQIVVYCRSGRRSDAAKKQLRELGVSVKNGINQATLEKILKPN